MLKSVSCFVLSLLSALFSLSLTAQSTPTAAELEQRIRELESKVASMQPATPAAELDELRRQIEILSKEIEALKLDQQPSDVTPSSFYGLGRSASKVYRSNGGVSIGGYGEMVYENFADETESGSPSGKRDQLDLLRAVLYTGYKFNDRVVFNSELEVEHATTEDGKGEVSMELAYLDFLLNPKFNVRAGLVLVPMGLINELHEPTAFLSSRRPEVERRIIPSTWSEPGVGVFGEWNRVSYRGYLVTGLNSEEFSSSGIRSGRQGGAEALAESLAVTGRIDWSPIEGTLFGGGLYTGDSSQGRTTSDGKGFGARVTLADLHASSTFRGLSLRALWSEGTIGDVRRLNLANGLQGAKVIGREFGGWYGEVGYDLFSRSAHGEQSLTPFARYEQFGTQRGLTSGSLEDRSKEKRILTMGVAWKPIPQAVIKFDWQKLEDDADEGVDQINAALGYIF